MTRLRASRAAVVLACAACAIIGGPAHLAAQDTAPAAPPSDRSVAVPERLVTVLPRYPRGAEPGTAGTVTLRYTVDATGRPVDVHALPELDRPGLYSVNDVLTVAPKPDASFQDAAINAVRQWVYAPPANGGVTFLVQFVFLSGGRVRLGSHEVVEPANSNPGVAAERSGAGDPFVFTAGQTSDPAPHPDIAREQRVGPLVPAPRRTRSVNPIYPADARTKGIQGVVAIDITVDAQGRVTSTRVVRSIPELDAAAIEAVRKWEFEPSQVNGQPGSVTVTVTVDFTLSP